MRRIVFALAVLATTAACGASPTEPGGARFDGIMGSDSRGQVLGSGARASQSEESSGYLGSGNVPTGPTAEDNGGTLGSGTVVGTEDSGWLGSGGGRSVVGSGGRTAEDNGGTLGSGSVASAEDGGAIIGTGARDGGLIGSVGGRAGSVMGTGARDGGLVGPTGG